ncbi:MAG TPA: hypothetical protein VNT51_12750, partial [Miltoncostaeaceae bacterium]|nr:hypothetical protein [Miltoncostaeaceae bacterium]
DPASAYPGRLTLVYDTAESVDALVRPARGPGLSPARGALRQDPAPAGMLQPGDNRRYRVAKVSGRALAGMSAPAIAALLRSEIQRGSSGAGAHLVAVDEITGAFGEPPPARPRRGGGPSPIDPNGPGARFTAAMRMLSTPSPYGGTWAERVLVYLAPAVHTSIAAGRGPHRNLGRDGKPHRRTWRAVMPGLALSGGVHLLMYHGVGGGTRPFTAGMWRGVPGAFLNMFGRYGGDPTDVHFVFTGGPAPRGAPRGCGAGVTCAWRLAESTPAGRTVLANGPAVYRLGGQAPRWLREFNRRFP